MSAPMAVQIARSAEIRLAASAERSRLRSSSERELVRAIVDPSLALGSLRLQRLFGVTGKGAIAGISRSVLLGVFADLAAKHPLGRQFWNENLRLRELTETERRRLIRALLAQARGRA